MTYLYGRHCYALVNPANNKLGEPVIELLPSGKAVRKFPILRK